MNRSIIVRVVAIFLCALIVLSGFTVAFYAFAAEETASVTALPATGSAQMTWVIVAVALAILVVVACVVIPKIKKK